jgi:tRNA threonylcarbamoyladenosine biosynthesis protein TsaB
MNLLAIDTSTDLATVALSKDDAIFCLEKHGVRQHAQQLLPMIAELLDAQNMNWSHLAGIVYGKGPGGFTGLRVACSVAKALAYAQNLPIYGVTSLHALATQARALHPDVGILACGDARMQEVYWAYYPPTVSLMTADIQVSPVQAIAIAETNPIVLVGWGLEAYHEQWSLALQTRFITHYAMYPKAETLIQIVQNGECSAQSAEDASPMYVRNQVAETGERRG